MASVKTCSKCGKDKPLTEFYFRSENNTTRSDCKKCCNASAMVGYHKNRERRRKTSYKYVLRTSYGMTVEDYNSMCEQQNNKCLLCEEEKKLVVDHCHSSGKVRGLLCGTCNTGLGSMKDSVSILGRAIEYIKTHSS